MLFNWNIYRLIKREEISEVESLLKKSTNIVDDEIPFLIAINNVKDKNKQLTLINLLLTRFNPSYNNNKAIIDAYEHNNIKCVNLLWEDKRVKNTLKNDSLKLYNLLVKKDIHSKLSHFS